MKKQIGLSIIMAVLFNCTPTKDNPNDKSSDTTTETTSDFEFGGNYLPTKEFKIKDHLLNSIEIGTNDSLKGNQIELIYIRFTNLATHDYYVVTNTKFEGTKDNFLISAVDSVLGKIQVSGNFIGERGPSNDNVKSSTIVFTGFISADGINKDKLECRYFEGD